VPKLFNVGRITFQPLIALPALAGIDPSVDTRTISAGSISHGGSIASVIVPLIGQDGNGIISQDGNSIVGQGGGNLVNTNGSNILGQGGGNLVNTNGSNIVGQGGGNVVATSRLASRVQFGSPEAEAVPAGFDQTGGETNLDGVILTGSVTLDGGVLSGSGVIYGDLTNNGGYITPGHSPGILGVNGNFTQGSNGTLVVEDGGATPNLFDQVQVAGTAILGGTLDLQLINGYKPDAADTFSPLAFNSVSGKFASISANGTVAKNDTGILTTVDPVKPAPQSGQAVNISTRAQVQTGDDVVIGGFIVTGPAGSTKKVVLRGIGPSLASAGVAGALSDPYLELYSGPTLLKSNDNWQTDAAAVKATGVPPTDPLESAIVDTLSPGAYTVVLHGTNGETGVGLVEIYDLDTSSAATLANISTRSKVQAGDDVMIGGFILEGGEPAQVLVRGIGPSLAGAGVSGVLADPVLELHDANGAVITNNDWRETQESDIIATTVPPTKDKEAAIVMTLPPGQYTAILRGNENEIGVGLVEVYKLD
jgi:hypothetical protein